LQEEKTLFDFLDDEKLSRTKKLTITVSTIRRFRDSLTRTIQAWDNFDRENVQMFGLVGLEALRPRWEGYLSQTRENIAELRSYRELLRQKLELFNSMRDGVCISICFLHLTF
jgi:hypothetical protein